MEKKVGNKKIPVLAVTLLILLNPVIIGKQIQGNSFLLSTTIGKKTFPTFQLIPHEPILITADVGFEEFPGNGTEENPHIIEGYNITTNNDHAISIKDSTKYFIIRNCLVQADMTGIGISNATEGTAIIFSNICVDSSSNGIVVSNSNKSKIESNVCNDSYYGIRLINSNFSTVTNNSCNYNFYGIKLHLDYFSTVANNSCTNQICNGINLDSSYSATITGNNCANNNESGIYLDNSYSAFVVNNSFHNDGLAIYDQTLSGYLSHTVENNWVNERPLGYYSNLVNATFSDFSYGQLILINCTGAIVQDLDISHTSIGLSIYYCKYAQVVNNTIYQSLEYSILLDSSSYSLVANNSCINNNNNENIGVVVYNSSFSEVVNNTCNYNLFGMLIEFSSSCLISFNHLQENIGYGIVLVIDTSNNIIHHNRFINNCLDTPYPQAYDDGRNNVWYDEETKEGNYWSDWDNMGSYKIDGYALSVDKYPLNEGLIRPFPFWLKITLISVSVIAIVITSYLFYFYKVKKTRIRKNNT